MSGQYWQTSSHGSLSGKVSSIKSVHLRDLLKDEARNNQLIVEAEGVLMDLSRQKVTPEVMKLLFELAQERDLSKKIGAMFSGDHLNSTEDRAVLHVALRSHANDVFVDQGKDVVKEVHEVLNQIQKFSDALRSGQWKGFTGTPLTDVVCIGIGGSYLGPEFVLEALRTYGPCKKACEGRRLRFLANVDPIDVARATEGLNPETTLVVIVSKTFTTAETMLNARTLRHWLMMSLQDEKAIGKHMIAVTTNVEAAKQFGILPENCFGFWDWVGGRFSVCSAVGCVPLALHFGFEYVRQFLDGCRAMDLHFKSTPMERNLPVLMGLIGIWNSTYLDYSNVAILPYCQALLRFAAHIQQLTMESNGKRVTINGAALPHPAGEIFFGEPGTNGQHSFYQLLHQGRVVPADFIGFCHSQNDIPVPLERLSNHDELMANFFAQPNALALGKTEAEVKASGCPESLVQHKVFSGDRPSTSLLLSECNPHSVGLLLSLYEHRTAVQGFIWGINSFDQWGVELGKVLAKDFCNILESNRSGKPSQLETGLPSSSRTNAVRGFVHGRFQELKKLKEATPGGPISSTLSQLGFQMLCRLKHLST
ncbi:uncharacterized protein LOC129617137 [Condylostylus longicornis]|uniref:uncharacterized protein LOC129617137 n=1 Tax=Condylostylus longicornis TaxID=2530218 RepID=UPI00244DC35B|nr:uncharacterized protein LOC129617137 [Condylostylus longicornis]